MSHFTVLVVGPDVDGQLAPFHEFECTGEDDQYVQDIDITEQTRQEYEDWKQRQSEPSEPDDPKSFAEFVEYWDGHKLVPFGQEPDLAGEHKYGYCLLDENGDVLKDVDRTNPNAEWDWYQVGGRWNGYFKLKPGASGALGEPSWCNRDYPGQNKADEALKGDIDFEAMRNEAAEDATRRYAAFVELTQDHPPIQTWKTILGRHGGESASNDGVAAARSEYNGQPGIKALREDEQFRFSWNVESYITQTRDEYIAAARNGTVRTFAVVKDGKWYERGDMGWWGVVSDEKNATEWDAQFSALIDTLPDDTLLTLVDCHI